MDTEADDTGTPRLTREAAKMVGIVTATSIALQLAVNAHPRIAALDQRLDDIREGARAGLGNFHGQPAFDGIEIGIRDFVRMLRRALGGVEEPIAKLAVPEDPLDGIRSMVGTITALEVALKITVETNPRAVRLRERFDDVREVAIAQVIGGDVVDEVFDGIDYTMDTLDDLLPPAPAR